MGFRGGLNERVSMHGCLRFAVSDYCSTGSAVQGGTDAAGAYGFLWHLVRKKTPPNSSLPPTTHRPHVKGPVGAVKTETSEDRRLAAITSAVRGDVCAPQRSHPQVRPRKDCRLSDDFEDGEIDGSLWNLGLTPVNPWPSIGMRRRPDEYGVLIERRLSEEVFWDTVD